MRRAHITLVIVAGLLSLVTIVAAQSSQFQMAWFTAGGGGNGPSSSGAYSISGTAGQGGTPASQGTFGLVGGFWAREASPQIPTPVPTRIWLPFIGR
jgi:hypothetical protein